MKITNSSPTYKIDFCKQDEFKKLFDSRCVYEDYFDSLGDEFIELDIKLSLLIGKFFDARLSDDEWHQSDMCNTDGVRVLSFVKDVIVSDDIHTLENMLRGGFAKFSILCNVYEDFEEGDLIGRIGIFKGFVLASKPVMSELWKVC